VYGCRRVIPDYLARLAVQFHFNPRFLIGALGKVDAPDRSLLNSVDAHFRSSGEARHAPELGIQPIPGSEQHMVFADPEHPSAE